MKKKRKLNLILIIFVLVLVLGLGYAYLTTTLSINGTTDVDANTWDIHFENIYVDEDSVSTTTPTISNQTTVTYSVHLSSPGDFYEFDVDLRNSGTIDAMIESFTSTINNQAISNLPNYLDYYVKYYDDIAIANNQLLRAGDVETIIVHIGYKDNINPSDLPSSSQTLNLSFTINEVQATSSAVTRTSNYLYTATGTLLSAGIAIPNGVTAHSDYKGATAEFGYPIFIRHVMKNNIIIESTPGFIYDGNVYYIKNGVGEYTYNYSKTILQTLFGSSSCTEYSSPNKFYYCTTSNICAITGDDGNTASYSDGGAVVCRYSIIGGNSDCFEQ